MLVKRINRKDAKNAKVKFFFRFSRKQKTLKKTSPSGNNSIELGVWSKIEYLIRNFTVWMLNTLNSSCLQGVGLY